MKVVIGQRVSVKSDLALIHGYTVTKVSPTGQVTVERDGIKRRFTPEGYEIGARGFYARARVVTTK